MLDFLHGEASDRKLRLFGCACCRRISHLLADSRNRGLIEAIEYDVDEPINQAEADFYAATDVAYDAASALATDDPGEAAFYAAEASIQAGQSDAAYYHDPAYAAAFDAARQALRKVEKFRNRSRPLAAQESVWAREQKAQCFSLRDIVGNPFRPISIEPAWLTPTVTSLAASAYDERNLPSGEIDPEHLAVLSDALEEAGCDDADILNHLRSTGPHVRGCWVVDLLLGKA